MPSIPNQATVDYVHERGSFNLRVVDWKTWFDHDQHLPLKEHGTVLRPLLAQASECLAYELPAGSEVLSVAEAMLTKERGRYTVSLGDDPVSGREYFWNASGGARGSILIFVQTETLSPQRIFAACNSARAMGNPSAGHTPSAYRYAKERVRSGDVVAFCLPRNNGFEWIDVLAKPEVASTLFVQACASCPDS